MIQEMAVLSNKITPSSVDSNNFGYAVYGVQSEIIVGWPDDSDSGKGGRVFIYNSSDGNPGRFAFSQSLNAGEEDDVTGNNFGCSVHGVTDNIVVGASRLHSNTGAVYIFVVAGLPSAGDGGDRSTDYKPEAKLIALDGEPGDYFGCSVAMTMNSNEVFVGAYGAGGSGAVYVYQKLGGGGGGGGGGWSQMSMLQPTVGQAGDLFGFSMSRGEDSIAIGSPVAENTTGAQNTGAVYLYNNDLELEWILVADGLRSGDAFGHSVSINDDALAVGAPKRSNQTGGGYVFKKEESGAWNLLTVVSPPSPSAGDQFGCSAVVMQHGSKSIFGSCGRLNGTGAVYKFSDDSVELLTPRNLSANSSYGASIWPISTNDFVVGAPSAGSVFVMYEDSSTPPPEPSSAPTEATSSNGSSNKGREGTVLQLFEIIIIAVAGGVACCMICVVGAVYKFNPDMYSLVLSNVRPKENLQTGASQVDTGGTKVAPELPLSQIYVDGSNQGVLLGTSLLDSKAMVRYRWNIDRGDVTVDNASPVLGRGGFGVVRRGTWKDGSRQYDVAIKVLSEGTIAGSADDLMREADMMVSLRSPFIVQMYGMCHDELGLLLVMELMGAGSLVKFFHCEKDSKKPSLALRVQMIQDVSRGLEYLHEKNVVHRDMKSPNILLTQEGKSLKAKIADFGLAKISQSDIGTTTGHAAMSLLWAAPEQFEERPKISKAVDIFAFGVIMWECVSLKLPHEGLGMGGVMRRVLSGQREEIPNNCPAIIARLIELCWAQQPEDRPKASYVREELMSIEICRSQS